MERACNSGGLGKEIAVFELKMCKNGKAEE